MIKSLHLGRPFQHESGMAYVAQINHIPSDRECFFLYENHQRIGSPDALHEDIRRQGNGLFSVWRDVLYFSASDGSDCNVNGRTYELVIMDRDALREEAIRSLAQDDETIIRLISGNTQHNNRFFINFFQYYENITAVLSRNGVDVPDVVLEIGCGARPYTALRFLLEGADRYVANDLFEVQSRFPIAFVEALRIAVSTINPRLQTRFESVFERDGNSFRVPGLQALGGRSFSTLDEMGTFDFIHSTSVLEHVQDPEQVAGKLAELVRSGGYMFHSIDFRDHRDFSDPFGFLKLSEEQYRPISTENRLRSSDWIALLERSGFEIMDRSDGVATATGDLVFYNTLQMIAPFVTETMRSGFDLRFRSKSLVDLSILCTQVLCRKR